MNLTMPPETDPASARYLRMVDTVLNHLESAILSGQLRPGERLVEATLADQLNVGRTTIREAMLMLEQRGLVLRVPRRGTYVTRLSKEDALDLAYSRSLLESFAVLVGLPRLNDAKVAELQVLVSEMGSCSLPADTPKLIKIDLAFHRVLVETAEMPRLIELWGTLDGQIGALFIRGVEDQEFDARGVAALHQRLLDAVKSGDRQEIQRAIHLHYVREEQSTSDRSAAMKAILEALGRTDT